MCVRELSNWLPVKNSYYNLDIGTASLLEFERNRCLLEFIRDLLWTRPFQNTYPSGFVGVFLMCSVLHMFCHTNGINSASIRIVCNRCCPHPRNANPMHFLRYSYFLLWFDWRTKMDSVAVSTLNYCLGNRIFGVNAMAFSLFPTLSPFVVIDGAVVAVAAVGDDDAAVAKGIDSVAESLP